MWVWYADIPVRNLKKLQEAFLNSLPSKSSKPVNGVVGLVFACHLGGASSILGNSVEGSEVWISGDRNSLSTWIGSLVKLLVPLLNNH